MMKRSVLMSAYNKQSTRVDSLSMIEHLDRESRAGAEAVAEMGKFGHIPLDLNDL